MNHFSLRLVCPLANGMPIASSCISHGTIICLQITRSIGDVYLKKPEFNREPLHSKFRLPESFRRPLLSSEPSITVHQIQLTDQFIIFASDGLWEHLSNQKAVELVHSSPRNVCLLILCLACFTWF
jgi:serine/threonine protein phosphatase PrpC